MVDNQSGQMVKWAGIIAVITAASKVFGFARESAVAYVFGTGMEADSYYFVTGILVTLFSMFHQSIVNAFLPVYGGLRKRGDSLTFVNTFLMLLLVTLMVLTLILLIFTTEIVNLLTTFEGEGFLLTVRLMQIMGPSIIVMGLSGLATGFLHAHHSFLAPSLIGFPHSIIIIIGSLIISKNYGIHSLAVITLFGYLSQFIIQLPWVFRNGYSIKTGIDMRHKGLREMSTILPPLLIAGSIGEIKGLIDRAFATTVSGGVSTLNYAARIRALPLGLLILPLITVLYPALVDLSATNDADRFKLIISKGISVITFLTLPIAVGTIVLGQPIVRLLFERGAFSASSTTVTTNVLTFYALGIYAEALQQLLTRSFFAVKNTRIPMKIGLITIILNIVMNYFLLNIMGVSGLALSTSICFFIGAGISLMMLQREIGSINSRGIIIEAVKSLFAAIIMGVAIAKLLLWSNAVWQASLFVFQAIQLFVFISLGASIYFLLAWVLKIKSMESAISYGRVLLSRLSKGLVSGK